MKSVRLSGLPASLPEETLARLTACLEDHASGEVARRESDPDHGPWEVEWFMEAPPSADIMTRCLHEQATALGLEISVTPGDWKISETPDIDWLAHSYQQFPPFSVGPFFLYGSQYDGPLPAEQLPLQIDAATAFGSGEHGTTAGCLKMAVRLHEQGIRPGRILDMGTGSGILAIGAWRLWGRPVIAADNDPEAVRVSTHHVRLNKVPASETGIVCLLAGSYMDRHISDPAPYDLVFANILAGPLIEMAPDLAASLSGGGFAILSGLLVRQEDEVLAAHRAAGLVCRDRIHKAGWASLLLVKEPA